MSNILSDAEEEIGRTAEEAARAVAAADAGEIAYQKSLAEAWEAEAVRHERSTRFWRGAALAELALIAGGMLAASLMK